MRNPGGACVCLAWKMPLVTYYAEQAMWVGKLVVTD